MILLLDSVSVDCAFLETCPFLVSRPIYCYSCSWHSQGFLCFCGVGCNFSIFISYFIDCVFSFFFLASLARGLSIFLTRSKKQLLV